MSRFMFLCYSEQHFIHAAIQTKLAEHFPLFLVSNHGEQLTRIVGFLKEAVEAYTFLAVRYSRRYLSCITRKSLSSALYDIIFQEPFYRRLYNQGPNQNVLCRVKKTMTTQHVLKAYFSNFILRRSLWKSGFTRKLFLFLGTTIFYSVKHPNQ